MNEKRMYNPYFLRNKLNGYIHAEDYLSKEENEQQQKMYVRWFEQSFIEKKCPICKKRLSTRDGVEFRCISKKCDFMGRRT